MSEYDKKFGIFLQNQEHEIPLDRDPNGLYFRQIKYDHQPDEQVKLNLRDLIGNAYANNQNYDLIKNDIHSGPITHIEFDHNFGVLFYSLGNHLYAFEKQNCFDLLTGKVDSTNIKQKILFCINFESKIGYIKVVEDILVINFGQNIIKLSSEQFIASNGDISDHHAKFVLDELSGNNFIRQISIQPQAILVTLNNGELFECQDNFEGRIVVNKAQYKCLSAVYNSTKDQVIALIDKKSEEQDHIFIFKSGQLDKCLNSIKLDFHQEVKRNYFKTYSISEFENGTYIIFAAFFESDDDKEENLGIPIVFTINKDINQKSNFKSDLKKSIQYFFYTDVLHAEDSDGKLPTIKVVWVSSHLNAKLDKVCIVQVNHCNSPYIFSQSGLTNKFKACDYSKLEFSPCIKRPKKKDGITDLMEDTEVLGTTLGIQIIASALNEQMNNTHFKYKLFEEQEDWCYPPILTIYGIDGNIYNYQIFAQQFQQKSCMIQINQYRFSKKQQKQEMKQIINQENENKEIKMEEKLQQDKDKNERKKHDRQNEEIIKKESLKREVLPEENKSSHVMPLYQPQEQPQEKSKKAEKDAKSFFDSVKKSKQDQQNDNALQKINHVQKVNSEKEVMKEQLKEREALKEKMKVNIPKVEPILAEQIFNAQDFQKFNAWLKLQHISLAQYNEQNNQKKMELNKHFEAYQQKIYQQNLIEQQNILKAEKERDQMNKYFQKQLHENKCQIKQFQDLNMNSIPTMNIFVHKLDQMLTDKYNQTVVKQIKSFQEQLATDLDNLPIIDSNLLSDELNDNGIRPIDLMKNELKLIGEASVKKDQFLSSLQQIKHDKYVSEQILGDHQNIQKDLINENSTEGIFHKLNLTLWNLKNEYKNKDPQFVQNLEQTLKKSRKYCDEFDKTCHIIEGLLMIDTVFKQQLLCTGTLSEVDLQILEEAILRKKQESIRYLQPIVFDSNRQVYTTQGYDLKEENDLKVRETTQLYLSKNMEIQGLFMKEIIENIDGRLEDIKALYQAKSESQTDINSTQQQIGHVNSPNPNLKSNSGLKSLNISVIFSDDGDAYEGQVAELDMKIQNEEKIRKKNAKKLKKQFLKDYNEGKAHTSIKVIEFEPKVESPKIIPKTEIEQWDLEFKKQLDEMQLKETQRLRDEKNKKIAQIQNKPKEQYVNPTASLAVNNQFQINEKRERPGQAEGIHDPRQMRFDAVQSPLQRADGRKRSGSPYQKEDAIYIQPNRNLQQKLDKVQKDLKQSSLSQPNNIFGGEKPEQKLENIQKQATGKFGGLKPLNKNSPASVVLNIPKKPAAAFDSPKAAKKQENQENFDDSDDDSDYIDPGKSQIFAGLKAGEFGMKPPDLKKSVSSVISAPKKDENVPQMKKTTSFMPQQELKPPQGQTQNSLFNAQPKKTEEKPSENKLFGGTSFNQGGIVAFGGGKGLTFGSQAPQTQNTFGSTSAATLAAQKPQTNQPQKTFGASFGGSNQPQATFGAAIQNSNQINFGSQPSAGNQSQQPSFGKLSQNTFGASSSQPQNQGFGMANQNLFSGSQGMSFNMGMGQKQPGPAGSLFGQGGNQMFNQPNKMTQNVDHDPFATGNQAPKGFGGQQAFGANQGFAGGAMPFGSGGGQGFAGGTQPFAGGNKPPPMNFGKARTPK